MKPIYPFALICALTLGATAAMARDEQERPDYYNSQRTSHGERTVAAPRVDVDEHMPNHGDRSREEWRRHHNRAIANDIADGADNDGNNRGRHAFIFPKGASQVVKH